MKSKQVIAAKTPTSKEDYLKFNILIAQKKGVIIKRLVHLITHVVAKDGMLSIYLLGDEVIFSKISITALMAMLPEPQFVQCHESYIVNALFITKHTAGDGGMLLVAGVHSVPVSRIHKDEVMAAMVVNLN